MRLLNAISLNSVSGLVMTFLFLSFSFFNLTNAVVATVVPTRPRSFAAKRAYIAAILSLPMHKYHKPSIYSQTMPL